MDAVGHGLGSERLGVQGVAADLKFMGAGACSKSLEFSSEFRDSAP